LAESPEVSRGVAAEAATITTTRITVVGAGRAGSVVDIEPRCAVEGWGGGVLEALAVVQLEGTTAGRAHTDRGAGRATGRTGSRCRGVGFEVAWEG
jgi:hypothetical protein